MEIKFSHNWNNKLSGQVFTTIRNSSNEKGEYYTNQIGKTFDVWLKGQNVIKKAVLVNVRPIQYNKIPLSLIAVDTGIVDVNKQIDLFKRFGMKETYSIMLVLTFDSI